MKQIVIFDLDGTLLDTIADLGAACNYALSRCGLPTHTADEYPRLVGNGINRLIERALPEEWATLGEDERMKQVLRVRQEFVPYYNEHNRDLTHPYEGIPEVLKTLRAKGVLLAVASNKYQAATERIVSHFFGDAFDVVLGERENVPRKPHPQIVQDIWQATEKVSCSEDARKKSTLYVGDSQVDIETARCAGVQMAACTWGFASREELTAARPDFIIDSPVEIIALTE